MHGKTTFGSAERRDLLNADRFQRAAKIFGAFFFVAFITLFIPILHFVLPPLFLLVGGGLAFATWTERGWIERAAIHCPNCGVEFRFDEVAESWPKSARCPGCSCMLEIKPV